MTIRSTRRRFIAASSLAALLAGGKIAAAKPAANRSGVTTARPDAEVEGVFFYGQSNAGAGGHAKPVLTQPVFPDVVSSFRGAQQSYGGQTLDPQRLQGTGAVADHPKYPPFPATAMAYALAADTKRSLGHRFFMHTVWYGGQPLTAFLQGGGAWSNLMSAARRMRETLAENGSRGRIAALVLIQGEAGPPGHSAYRDVLNLLLDQTLPALKAQTGQDEPPVAIILQTNASNVQATTAREVALAQWDVARARPHDAVLAGPMYQFPLDDAVHQSTIGRMMLGDLLALVYEARVRRGEPFEPLHPLKAVRDGDLIRVAFKRPAGSLPLRWDDAWAPRTPNYGFVVRGGEGAAAIDSIAISGDSEIAIRLARPYSDRSLIVRYAMEQPFENGWAPGRGQLIAPTERRSAFAGMHFGAPEFVSHYCIRFEMPVQ